MLIFKRGFFTTEKWFATRLHPIDAFGIVVYVQVPYTRKKLGFLRKPFSTILIDLNQDSETLLQGFARQTRSQIEKAKQLGIATRRAFIADLEPFFNEFARAKRIRPIKAGFLRKIESRAFVTQAELDGAVLVMHCHLLDEETSRARILFSASTRLAIGDPETRKLIGYANRYLHWRDMALFSEMGYKTYDFGGYSNDKDDREKQQINQFKKGFGKNVVEEYSYLSPLAALLRRFKTRARHHGPLDRSVLRWRAVPQEHRKGSLATAAESAVWREGKVPVRDFDPARSAVVSVQRIGEPSH